MLASFLLHFSFSFIHATKNVNNSPGFTIEDTFSKRCHLFRSSNAAYLSNLCQVVAKHKNSYSQKAKSVLHFANSFLHFRDSSQHFRDSFLQNRKSVLHFPDSFQQDRDLLQHFRDSVLQNRESGDRFPDSFHRFRDFFQHFRNSFQHFRHFIFQNRLF